MKNIDEVDTEVKCWHCKSVGYYSFEFQNMTCPCCELIADHECKVKHKNGMQNGTLEELHYCDECNILFDAFGCVHDEFKYNAHLIKEYEFDGVVYKGMPMFDSLEEWREKVHLITIVKMCCPNYACQRSL